MISENCKHFHSCLRGRPPEFCLGHGVRPRQCLPIIDAAGSREVDANRNGQAGREPGRRCRSTQVAEMDEAVPSIVRAVCSRGGIIRRHRFFPSGGVIGVFKPAGQKKRRHGICRRFAFFRIRNSWCGFPDPALRVRRLSEAPEQLIWLRPFRYRSKRSRVITLVQAAMKSCTKSSLASLAA